MPHAQASQASQGTGVPVALLWRPGGRYKAHNGLPGIKSSIQRHIRSALLAQLPFLSLPANPAPRAKADKDDSDDSDSEDEVVVAKKDKKGGAGPGKGGKGKGGKGRGRDDVEEDKPEEGSHEDVLTVLEVIWPKKEGLTLVKWCVADVGVRGGPT